MYDLVLRPHRFLARQSSEEPDLFFPALIVISLSGIGFAIALEVSRGLSVPEGLEGLTWRVSLLTSAIAALTNVLLWPLTCGVILATGLVLWGRTVSYRRLLAAVGYAQLPMLLGGLLSLAMVIFRPVIVVPHGVAAEGAREAQEYLYAQTVLGVTRYVSGVAGLWTGVLLTLAVRYNLRLDIFRAAVTVLLPYVGYRSAVFLMSLAR
jgi:hypothetical protein